MFELCSRLVLAGLLVFLGGAFPILDFSLAMKVAIGVTVIGGLAYQLERKNLRSAGLSGLIAAADATAIAILLARHNALSSLGFLVLVPIGYAAYVHGVRPLSVAAIASAALLGSQAAYHEPITGEVLGQVMGVLMVGVVTGRRREVEREIEIGGIPDALADLKERYRELRVAYQELEVRSRNDRASASLSSCVLGDPQGWGTRIASRIAALVGAERVVLYVRAEYGPSFVVKSVCGEPGNEQAFEANFTLAPAQTRYQADKSIRAMLPAGTRFETAIINHGGHLIGLVQIEHRLADALETARLDLEEIAPYIAEAMAEGQRREDTDRRRREAELLYDMASLATGAESSSVAAARFVRELAETLHADHVGVYMIELEGARPLARQGVDVRLLERMSFAHGPGLPGWVKIDAPELLMFDVRADSRCPSDEALKARIGSYLVIPIEVGGGVFGYLSAASYRTGGLDLGAVETLRVAAAELGHSLSRMREGGLPEGLMNPREFFAHVGGRPGSLVVLDPIRLEKILDTFGRPAVAHALRRFSRRVAARLPQGGALCRRAEGDFLAFLPECDEAFASRWANEIAATASMIGLRTPDGSNRIPLAIRARIAVLDPQTNGIFEGLAA